MAQKQQEKQQEKQEQPQQTHQPRWLLLAIASGTFAAMNGVFAKLTTDTQTASLTKFLNPNGNSTLELVIRGTFLALNMLSNIIMWALFTRALTASPSTTKVSITNTSANFLATAMLGMLVFKESVGGLWWVGAGMMGVGCILVGMRDA